MSKYESPFPWFGGKGKIASTVWKLFGDVDLYVEPFFGAGHVLFNRPEDHRKLLEVINDKDMLVVNFWRAVQNNPEEVAKWSDNPVFEADLTARHIWLVKYGIPELKDRIQADPNYYDAKIAGWWAWGRSAFIGSGWCLGRGCWTEQDGKLVQVEQGSYQAIHKQIPHIIDKGKGVIAKRNKIFSMDNKDYLINYFRKLADRLSNVRITNGDWTRVVKKSILNFGKVVGIFLDPPYSKEIRDNSLYINDEDVSKLVNQWCVENGDNPRYRIVLCGYEGEHNNLEDLGWKKIAWVAGRSYGTSRGKTRNSENRFKERIWYNLNCL